MPDKDTPVIYVVDDELSIRKAMERLMISMELAVQTFSSGEEFLVEKVRDNNACLIADIKMSPMGGLELQRQLIKRGSKIPVIFITAFDSENVRQAAKDAGAVGYFRKPVDAQALIDSIRWALSLEPSPKTHMDR